MSFSAISSATVPSPDSYAAGTVQINISVPPHIRDRIDEMATDLGLSRSATIRRAIGIAQAIDNARRRGAYVGTSRDREKLDIIIATPSQTW